MISGTVDMVVRSGETDELRFEDALRGIPVIYLGEKRVVIKYYLDGYESTDSIAVAVRIPRKELAKKLAIMTQGDLTRLGTDRQYVNLARQTSEGNQRPKYHMDLVSPGYGANIHGLDVTIPLPAMRRINQYARCA